MSVSIAYDPLGNLVSETVNGATANYQVDPDGNVVAAFSGSGPYNNSGGLTAHYTYGLSLVSQVNNVGVAAYYDFNGIGSTVDMTTANGTIVNRYTYLPFSAAITVSAGLANPFTTEGAAGALGMGFDPKFPPELQNAPDYVKRLWEILEGAAKHGPQINKKCAGKIPTIRTVADYYEGFKRFSQSPDLVTKVETVENEILGPELRTYAYDFATGTFGAWGPNGEYRTWYPMKPPPWAEEAAGAQAWH